MSRAAAHYRTVTKRDLSPRQREVLALVAAGKTNGEVAERLGISLDGAKWHVSEILAKLGVATREEAAEWWRERQGLGHRVSQAVRGFGPLFAWKVAVPVAVVAALGVAGLLFLGSRGDDGDAAALDRCTVDDVILEPVEGTSPPVGPVAIAITARSREGSCTFEGTITGTLRRDGQDLHVGTIERPRTTIDATRAIIGWATWNALCPDGSGRVEFRAELSHNGESESFAEGGLPFVVARPVCPEHMGVPRQGPDFAVTLSLSPEPAIGPDPLDAVYCYPSDTAELAKWIKPCEAVDRLQQGLLSKNVDQVIQLLELREYTCPEPGSGGIGGPSILCEGAAAGEVRHGVPVSYLGSAGDALSPTQLKAQLEAMIETAKDGQLYRTRIATVSCREDPCTPFILGIANDGSPAAAYFRFEARGDSFRIVGAGFAGENAIILRRGGQMPAGLDQFVPIVGPY